MQKNTKSPDILSAVCFALSMAFVVQAHAQEQDREGELWVNIGGFSSHFNKSKDYNENNAGIGVEYHFSNQTAIMAGSYHNSLRKQTTYAAVNWQPYTLGDWKIGLSAGLIDGYPGIVRGGTFFAAMPLVTYEVDRFGVNFGIIPSIDKIGGSVIAQLKFRVN